MQALPHHYTVTANADSANSNIAISSAGVVDITTDAPAEFGGPGDCWSPEGLLIAAIADCFSLTFRAIAGASKLEWQTLSCEATGTLDKVDRVSRFTEVALNVTLQLPAGPDEDKVVRLLHKAEENCLITNSMTATIELSCDINFV
ncbi:OsmC-like protein [Luminiphilus syltensis NOR5-1B]|uniref:OsmC-like protein n=1 Tax=Luminiphilus syltensis NOR5-1B TaxID=565045 RepID=B8KRW1_9GAMM|nr:OsmC family protein [Luminiphilus syltensis]EED34833.1 OsmC-like protein [Luminiphilus syltensis NOR5-1B]